MSYKHFYTLFFKVSLEKQEKVELTWIIFYIQRDAECIG